MPLVSELLELSSQAAVSLLQRGSLMQELRRHVVEGRGQTPDLVGRRGLDPLVELAARDGGGALGQLLDRPRDPTGDQGRCDTSEQERREGQRAELEPRAPELGFHPPLGQPEPHGAPLPTLDEDRHSEVVDGLAGGRDGFLGQRLTRARRALGHGAVQEEPHALGIPAVGRHLAVGVEHERVDDVGLGADPHDVLLQGDEVVDEQWAHGDRREAPSERLAAPLHFGDDPGTLLVVDHHHDGRHDENDHEDRAE